MRITTGVIALSLSICVSVGAEQKTVVPGENLVIQGIGDIPKSIADSVARYTEFRSASFADWHPTRREMIIRTRFGSVTQAHHVAAPGGARRQLTFFDEPVGAVRYEPTEGKYFVFSKDIGGDEFYQLFRFDLATGEATLLTDGEKRHSIGPWSDSGQWLAYRKVDSDARGAFTEIRVMNPMEPEKARLVATLRGGGWSVADFSPDERSLLLSERISINESYFWLMSLRRGRKTLLTPQRGGPSSYRGGKFSNDGKSIYASTDENGEFQQLTRIGVESRSRDFMTAHIAWDVSGADVSPDGKTIAVVTNENGISVLRLLDAETGEETKIEGTPLGIIGGLRWHKNGRDLAFTMSSARSSSDVYSLDLTTKKIERWTASETGGLDTETFVEPELIEWKSFDGLKITGFLYKPPSRFTGPRPVIVNIHGGPEGQSRPGFKGSTNYYLDELGVAVIYPNVRGSAGYGKTFVRLDNGIKRTDTYKDIEALLDLIGERDDLDAERIMITGGSYGGHMTLAIATYYNDRIACSVDVVGISNLRTFLENTKGYRRDLRRVEYGDERDPEIYAFLERTAPLNRADKITKPLFVVQGANDPRVPMSESDQMVEIVKKNGAPVWYLVAKDEGHGFRKKPNRDYQLYSTVKFIQNYLLAP